MSKRVESESPATYQGSDSHGQSCVVWSSQISDLIDEERKLINDRSAEIISRDREAGDHVIVSSQGFYSFNLEGKI